MILLIISPYNAADIGFQLSFLATLFILVFSGKLEKILTGLCVPGIISGALACMICAQIGMIPILITLSGKQSFILMVISIGGVFISQGICLLSIPICILRYCLCSITFLDTFFKVLFLPISGLLHLIIRLSQFGSFESVGALRLQSVHPVLLIALCGMITIICLPSSYARRMLSKINTIVIALGICLNIVFFINRPIATVIFTDVGQGDCAIILCDQKCIIIDGGDVGEGNNTIIPLLNYYGIRKVDIAILTHPHSDHAAGLIELIEAEIIIQIGTPDIHTKKNHLESNSIFIPNELLYQLDAGDNIEICDKVKLFVLSPSSDNLIEGEEGVNENSLVSLLTIGSTGILFMGDAGFQTEESLLQDKENAEFILQNADFLKVGHHGSKYSTSSEFLENMNLKAAVISVGPNYFGHPTDETLKRLSTENVDVYRTDHNGAVIVDIFEKETRLRTMISCDN
jgi:competence protein ComEC